MQDILDMLKNGTETKASRKKPSIIAGTGLPEAEAFAVAKAKVESAEAEVDVIKGKLYDIARAEYFRANFGAEAPISTVEWRLGSRRVTAGFGDTYTANETAVKMLDVRFVRPRFSLEIDGDQMTPEQARAFIPALLALAQSHGIVVKSGSKLVPTQDFAVRRHGLPVETNLALEAAGLGTRVTLKLGTV